MSEAPRDNCSGSPLSSPLFRNSLAAIFLSLGLTCGANEALSAPKNQEQINAPSISKNPPKPDKFKITEKQQRCGLVGTLRLSGKSVIIEAVCVQGKKITLGDIILLPDKSGHFPIPRTNAYFYLSDTGEPTLSFIKDGERVSGMMSKDENEEYYFDQYLEFIE
jgi:hypothetical protein